MASQDSLYRTLTDLGDLYLLDFYFDPNEAIRELSDYEQLWVPYNPRKSGFNRTGLSLTSLDGGMSGIPDLDSIREYNIKHNLKLGESDFNVPTPLLKNSKVLKDFYQYFEGYFGRSHYIKLAQGGYFPPHRDSPYPQASTFRIISFINNCSSNDFCFILDDKIIHPRPGVFYFMNTKKTHSCFSYSRDTILLVFNIILSSDSVSKVLQKLLTY